MNLDLFFSTSIVVLLLVLGAFCSLVETAFTAASPAKLRKYRNSMNENAVNIGLSMLKNREKIVNTFLIFYSTVLTVATTVATGIFIDLMGESGMIAASIVMTLSIIIFTEVIPKALGIAQSELTVIRGIYFARLCMQVIRPINFVLVGITKLFFWILRIKLNSISPTDEVRGIIEHHCSEGNVNNIDRKMIDGVLDLSEMVVADVMIHRGNVNSVCIDQDVQSVVKQALEFKNMCIPLWRDNNDNIVAVLSIKRLVAEMCKVGFSYGDVRLESIIDEPYFVHDNALISKQIRLFNSKRHTIAIVVNEYGDYQGIVSIDDMLDEIIGETNLDGQNMLAINKGNKWIVDGGVAIRDFNKEFGFELPDFEANTIAGLVISEIERIPDQGETFEMLNMKVTVRKRVGNKIKTVVLEMI